MASNSRGMTLIEIILAIMLLSIVSVLTSVNIQRSLSAKKKIDADVEAYASVRDAINLISHDVNKAFHWKDVNEELQKKIQEEQKKALEKAGQPVPPSQVSQYPTPIPSEQVSAFVGESNKLDFTTLTNTRIKANSPESDQAKVGYFVKSVKSVVTGQSTMALVRRLSPYLDGDVTRGGKETTLLEDVVELKFRYLGGDNKEWKTDWRSDRKDDQMMAGKFPNAVEITLSAGKDKRVVKIVTIATIHMTNNEDFFGPPEGATGAFPVGGAPIPTPPPTPVPAGT